MNSRIKKLAVGNLVAIDVTKLVVLADCSDDGILESVCLVRKEDVVLVARALTEYYKKYFYVLSADVDVEAHTDIVENYLSIPKDKLPF